MGKRNVNVSDSKTDLQLETLKNDGVDLPTADSSSESTHSSSGSKKKEAKDNDNASTGSRRSVRKSIPRDDSTFIRIVKKILGMSDEERDDWEPVNAFNREGIRDFFIGMKRILLGNRINILLIFIPFAFIAEYAWGDITIFILSMLGIVPLAKLLGAATEELALRTNQTIGGLLNATFGNAVEMIISIIALAKNLPRIVQASLLGSILSNLLLVLGMAMLFGGIKYKEQSFNSTASQTTSSMLLLSVASLVLPAAFLLSGDATLDANAEPHGLLPLSHATAIVLLVIYGGYLTFQLKTHKHLYEEGADEEEEVEKSTLSLWGALVLLTGVTVLVAFLAEYMVGSIETVTKEYSTKDVSETFIAIILLPIVGNAAEHVTAVTVATKDKMDLSIGVAVGSSVQIALLVVPALVILGWIIDVHLTLFFRTFETVALFITVLVVNSVVADGHSNWLEGALLIAIYVILGVGFWFHE